MYIREVELRNFKSFGKRVVIPLPNDFIAVTGPNGSGKSNIVDALLFALCLSSSRAMRAERLPDLVYRGGNGKSPDYAQVTVRLDNASRAIPLDNDVIEISRKVKINNDKYNSTYYLNGKTCSQGELQDHLSRAGITPEGYNVVMQGDVTRIIEVSPFERRRIIDEIAGVAEFEEKRRKALAELDVVKDRVDRVDVILEEVSSQLDRLRAERDKALAYQASREEKRRQQAYLLLAKLKEAESDLSCLAGELKGAREEQGALALARAKKAEELASFEASLQELNGRIAHKGEEEQIQVKRRIEELKGEIALEAQRADFSSKAAREAEALIAKDYLEIQKLEQEISDLVERQGQVEIRRASVQGELEEQGEAASAARHRIAQADIRYSELREELEEALGGRMKAKDRLGDLLRERDRILDSARRGSLDRDRLEALISQDLEALDEADREGRGIRSQVDEMHNRAVRLERERDDLEGARLRARREISEADRNLQRMQGEYARAEARARVAEDRTGYSRAVEAIRSAMRQGVLRGLHGTIADLGEVDSRYSAALEIAAGARLQSVVARSDEDASIAIDYLKRSQTGRATFLPLSRLASGSLSIKPQEPGVVDYAINLVTFDSHMFNAFWYVFRDTLVVDNLSTARRMMGRYRMVTIEGDLVEKSGAMTGGHYKSRVKFAADESRRLVEFSERLSSVEAERSALLDRLDSFEEALSRVKRELEGLDKEMSRLTFRMEELGSGRIRLDRSLQERRELLSQLGVELTPAKERLAWLDGEIEATNSELAGHNRKVEETEAMLGGSDIPRMTSLVESAEGEMRRLESRIKELDGEIMRNRLREESLIERSRELSARKEDLEAKRSEAQTKEQASLARKAELATELAKIAEREGQIEDELFGLKGERGRLLNGILSAQREIDRMEREVDRLEARITASSGAEVETMSTVQVLRAEIEASGVDANEVPPRSEVIGQKIRALDRAMQEMEPVNMLAIQEFEHVEQRKENLTARRDTLQTEREGIMNKLDKYDRMKKEAFMVCFNEINANFREVFNELSGGEGELMLGVPDDPLSGGLTIKARPAGKIFHRLEAMSGGEKSLTALSFIFAIQRFQPAPFYAMDEIDMFLDGANVEKVARMIKKISSNAQFLVVSLRKPMIQRASYTVGVTMQEKNITSVTGICMN